MKSIPAVVMAAALGTAAASALAQEFPTKPIRIMVGFSAGSTTDILARTIGQKMSDAWGQPVIVENRPSAGGVLASNTVATAAPDGHTLLVVSAGHAASAAMFPKLPYDTLKDFAGVGRIANVPSLLIVSPDLGVKSVKELVALAKSRPGQLNFSSPGVGSANHLAGELFKTMAGVDAAHVPYKGIPEAAMAVAFATSTVKRSSAVPDVPTLAEAGVPGYAFDPWFGMVAPAKTPKAVLAKLSREIASALEMPDVKERLKKLGADAAPSSPEAFDAQIRSEVAKFRKIVTDAGIKPE